MAPSTPRRTPTSQDAPPTTLPRLPKSTSQPKYDALSHTSRRELFSQNLNFGEAKLSALLQLLPDQSRASKLDWLQIVQDPQLKPTFDDAFDTLPGTPHYDKNRHEDLVFQQMRSVSARVMQTCKARGCGEPSHTLSLRPTRTPKALKPVRSRPDGEMSPLTHQPRLSSKTRTRPTVPTPGASEDSEEREDELYMWHNIRVGFEFKKEVVGPLIDKLGRENAEKALGVLQNQFWYVIARIFAWAVTIDGVWVRLWLAHRGGVLTSTPFHLHTDKHILLRILASFAYATPEELGIDTDMEELHDDALRTEAEARAREFRLARPMEHGRTAMIPFKLKVAGQGYIAVAIIADHRARALDGSGCRVLLAYNEPTPGDGVLREPVVAIKMVWRITARKSEGEIYTALMAAIETMQPPVQEASKYFVNIVAHGGLREPAHDIARSIMRGVDISTASVIHVPEAGVTAPRKETSGSHRSPCTPYSEAPHGRGRPRTKSQTEVPETFTIENRQHYVIALKNVGQPLHHEPDNAKSCRALADATQALKIMCLAGYNHRDISTGNIIVDALGHGRLGDLEFAKLFESNESNQEERTGTPDFMAVEVSQQRWLFATLHDDENEDDFPFRHHPGHDLESVYRCLVHRLLETAVVAEMSTSQADRQRIAKADFFSERGAAVFMGENPCQHLRTAFKGTTTLDAITRHVLPMVNMLKDQHRAFGKTRGQARQMRAWTPVHDHFRKHLADLSDHFSNTPTIPLDEWRKRERPAAGPAREESPTKRRRQGLGKG